MCAVAEFLSKSLSLFLSLVLPPNFPPTYSLQLPQDNIQVFTARTGNFFKNCVSGFSPNLWFDCVELCPGVFAVMSVLFY
jgi:hypothetical protein